VLVCPTQRTIQPTGVLLRDMNECRVEPPARSSTSSYHDGSRTGTVYETTRRANTLAAFSTRASGTFIFLDRVGLLKTSLRTVLQADMDYLVQTYIRESMLHADF
jgi:hypothetical protein